MNWYLEAFRNYANFSGRARRKALWMFLLTLLSLGSVSTQSQGISEAICRNHASVMETVISWRDQGVPIQSAKDVFDHEDNYELRFWLRDVVKQTYKDPKAARAFLSSGEFVKKCTEIHRGY